MSAFWVVVGFIGLNAAAIVALDVILRVLSWREIRNRPEWPPPETDT